MHTSAKKRMEWFEKEYRKILSCNNCDKLTVLDVGGRDVNGSCRDLFPSDVYEYVSLDIQDGKGVDIVPQDPYNWKELQDATFDAVISVSAFQHIEYPWKTMEEIKRVLKPGGICALIAPSNRYEVSYPYCCWGILKDGFKALAKSAELKTLDVSIGGVPHIDVGTEWDHELDDCMLIAQKMCEDGTYINDAPRFLIERRTVPNNEIRSRVLIDYLEKRESVLEIIENYIKEKNILDAVAVYGMSAIGKDIVKSLLNRGIQISQVIDKNDNLKELHGVKVVNWESADLSICKLVIVALTIPTQNREVVQLLAEQRIGCISIHELIKYE